jgi:hypothetical protein
MFVYDPSLAVVEAEEADVIAIHRSTEPESAAPEGLPPHPCNAYVCAIQRKGVTRVYVVLEHADRRGRWIFAAPEGVAEGDAHLPLLKEGLAFAASLGFTLQEVNLSYSKAMREVVIRDIPVIRRPSVAEPPSADASKEAASPVASSSSPVGGPTGEGKKEVVPKEKKETGPPAEKEREVKPSPWDESEAKVLAERLTAEKAAAERESRERLAALTSSIDLLVAERKEQDTAFDAQEAALQGEIARLTAEKERADREHATAVEPLRSTLERLKGEVDALGKGASSTVASLRDEIAWLKAEKNRAGEELAREEERLRAEVEHLAAARDKEEQEAARRIESLKARLSALSAEQETAAEENAARIRELEAEAERLAAEKVAVEKRAAADIAAMEAVIKQRRAEKDAARKLAIGQLARLAAEAEVLAAEREAVERFLSEREGGEMAAALVRAESEAATLRREVERLAAEKILAEQTSTARVASLQTEVTRLASHGTPSAPAPRGHAEPPKPLPVVAGPAREAAAEVSPVAEWDDEVASAVGEALAEGETDPFSFMGGGEEFVSFGAPGGEQGSGAGVGFSLDKSLEMIECDGPADVVEVHSSLNVVNITPAGRTPQPCGAYIIALKRGERFRVHVAWSLTADRSTLVYSPEKQPADAAECARVVRDALTFVETVGFMMDAVRLNPDLDKRGRALAKIPVLRLKK